MSSAVTCQSCGVSRTFDETCPCLMRSDVDFVLRIVDSDADLDSDFADIGLDTSLLYISAF